MDHHFWAQAWRTAQTPEASTVHHPFGKPGGPGLWHTGKELPAYIQNVAHAFRRKGMPESEAISQAVGVVRNWAEGHDGKGNKVHPDVQAAAAKAIAEWEKLRTEAHASGGSAKRSDPGTLAWQRAFGQQAARFDPYHAPAGKPGGGQFASAGGGGSPAAKHGKGTPKAAARPAPAHPQGARPPKESAAEMQRRHRLLAQAHADRQEARHLATQLHALEAQQHASATAAKKSAATAKAAAKAGHAAAHKRHTAHHHHHASHARSLKGRISALQGRITGLRQQAASLEARARAV